MKEIASALVKAQKAFGPALKTEEAPWGYKKDGTPRNRPGRPAQTMEVAS